MSDLSHLSALETGMPYRFADWPNPAVPRVAAGVYTVWLPDGHLLYVGMSGRGMRLDVDGGKRRGLWTRLNSHASGRRSGDQFCVYVCDRLVVPHLTRKQQHAIGAGALLLDTLTRELIREHFVYRFTVTADGAEALGLERQVQRGALETGQPLLNPLAPAATAGLRSVGAPTGARRASLHPVRAETPTRPRARLRPGRGLERPDV